jgi:hypothetical protein
MKLSHVDRHYVYFVEEMVRCKKCHEYMISNTELMRNLSIGELRRGGIKTCSNEFGVCDDCLASGGYPNTCSVCKKTKTYPVDFAYRTVEYGYEGDFDEEYICSDCLQNHPQKVIKILARSDDTEEIEHK